MASAAPVATAKHQALIRHRLTAAATPLFRGAGSPGCHPGRSRSSSIAPIPCFIPSTLGEDGDPLDVLILLDAPVMAGRLLTVRLLDVIEAEQRERDGKPMRNDRLIAAATHAHAHEHVKWIQKLPPYLLHEIEGFFAQYNRLRGKQFKPLGRGEPERARALLDHGVTAFRHKANPAEA